MTANEKILADIIASAEKKAEEIISAGEKNAEQILADAKLKCDKTEQDAIALAKQKAESVLNNGKSSAALLKRDKLLSYKQKMIEEITRETAEKIYSYDDEQYSEFLTLLLSKYALDKSGEITMNDRDLTRKLTSFKEKAKSFSLSVSDKPSLIDGGFILNYNGILINCSISALLREKKEEIADKISSILF